jgi:hypothetical protein
VEQFWRLPALPGAHSCTLLRSRSEKSSQGIRRESNPYLLVHSQACSDRYTTDTINWAAGTGWCGSPCFQSRYAIRVTGRAIGVGSASAFWTTRCQACR